MQKTTLITVLSLISLLFLATASSMEVYVRPPRIVARMNVTQGKDSTYAGFIEVKNTNNYTVTVDLDPRGELSDNIELSETSVELEPEELREIDFDLTLDEPGTHTGFILVEYSSDDLPGVAIQAEIIAIANEVEGNQGTNKYLVGSIIIVFLILLTIILVRRGKK